MGKYIKKFDTHSDYEDFIETADFIKPNVSYCVDNVEVHYNPINVNVVAKYNFSGNIPASLWFQVKASGVNSNLGINYLEKVIINGIEYDITELEENGASLGTYSGQVIVEYQFKNKKRIPKMFFYGCTELISIDVPNGVEIIEDSAFSYCSSLTKITLPDTIWSIGSLYNTPIVPSSGDGVIYIDNFAYAYSGNASEVSIRPGTVGLNDNLFAYNNSLTSVIIPEGVVSIGHNVLNDCQNLTSLNIPTSVKRIGSIDPSRSSSWAQSYCSDINNQYENVVYINNIAYSTISNLSTYNLKNNTIGIADGVFYSNSNLTNITIPNSVTYIGSSAFGECSNLTSITIPNSVTYIGIGAFQDCESLANVTISNNIIHIEGSTFSGCTELTNIVIPNSVIGIDQYAFYRCTNLANITMSNNISVIENMAFGGCSSLTKVIIPDSIASIGSDSFSSSRSLSEISIGSGIACISWSAFDAPQSIIKIYAENPPILTNTSLNPKTIYVPDEFVNNYTGDQNIQTLNYTVLPISQAPTTI